MVQKHVMYSFFNYVSRSIITLAHQLFFLFPFSCLYTTNKLVMLLWLCIQQKQMEVFHQTKIIIGFLHLLVLHSYGQAVWKIPKTLRCLLLLSEYSNLLNYVSFGFHKNLPFSAVGLSLIFHNVYTANGTIFIGFNNNL